jgi:plastocyanin
MLPVAFVVAALAFALPACGEDREGSVDESGGSTTTTGTGTTGTGTTTTPAAGGPAVATVTMTATEFEFDPKNPRVAKPGTVTFRVRNAGNAPHALEVEGPGGEVETDTIEPGQSATLKANLSRPGSYVLYCPVGDHESRGMKGMVTVAGGGGSSAGSTGTTTGEDSGTDTGDDSGGGGGSGKGGGSGGY